MAASITEFREHVQAIVNAEFAPEAIQARSDKLHESLGHDGAVAAVYPEAEMTGDDGGHNGMLVVIQFFGRYDLEIDPEQRVDPAKIEGYAWRLQRAFQAASDPNTETLWFYNVAEIQYPDDPTGNKTRFVMALEGFGPNATLHETTA